MKLNYISDVTGQNIDIEKLRPNKSYDYLIENRNASLSDLLNNPDRLEKFLSFRNCPTCGSKKYKNIIKKDGLDIVSCTDCSLVYVNPIFDEVKYQEIYKSREYQKVVQKLGEESHLYRVQRFGEERSKFIDQWHDPSLPKTYLDVGCSTGFTLEAIARYEWKATGLELNPSAARFAQSRGLNVFNQSIEEFRYDKKFSAISLFDVLEHLAKPKDMLLKLKKFLERNGNVYIYVPNWNSASRTLLGEQNCHYIWPTHHLTYFTPETLRNLLTECGFEVFHWETQGMDLIDLDWFLRSKMQQKSEFLFENIDALQFYINASGHGKNLRMYAKLIES